MNRQQRRAAKKTGSSSGAPAETLQALFAEAVALHQAGRLAEAATIYRRAAALDPSVAGLHLNLGLALAALGQMGEAEAAFRRAVAGRPDDPQAHYNLAVALKELGRVDEAVSCYRQVIALASDHAEALSNLGALLNMQSRQAEAIPLLQRALAWRPGYAAALHNLGTALTAVGRLDEAAVAFRQAIAIAPTLPGCHALLGSVLRRLGRHEEAAEAYRQAMALTPADGETLSSYGIALHDLGRLDEAEAACRRAADHLPRSAPVICNLGTVLQARKAIPEAIEAFTRALSLDPDRAETHFNLGTALPQQHRSIWPRLPIAGRWRYRLTTCARSAISASRSKRRATIARPSPHTANSIATLPSHAEAHQNLALALFRQGDFAEAFGEYRWRFPLANAPRPFPQPHWSGQALAGGRLLVWSEQGVGDEVMFASMLPDLVERAIPTVFECDRRTAPLFRRSFPAIEVVSREDPPDPATLQSEIAAQCPVGDLMEILRPDLNHFRRRPGGFLTADPAQRAALRERYSNGGLLVGIAWFSPNRLTGPERSIALSRFADMLAMPGIAAISLQHGDHRDEIEAMRRETDARIVIDDTVDQMRDLDRFGAQIAALDLVITIDNSCAHFAAALGIPTWVLLPFVPDWRWMLDRPDSHWYAEARLFRQQALNRWDDVLERVAGELARAAAGGTSAMGRPPHR